MKLKVNGKDLEFSVNMGFMGEFVAEVGLSYDEVLNLMATNPFKYIPWAMYESTKYAYDGEVDFTLKQFVKWIEKDGGLSDENKSTADWQLAFNEFMFGKNEPPPNEEDDKAPKKINWTIDIVSVALGELGLDYNYFKKMSWYEFRVRILAYERLQKKLDYRQRSLQYQTYVSNFYGKKGQKPISIDRYWQIDKKEIGVNEKAIARLRKAQEEYRNKKNG